MYFFIRHIIGGRLLCRCALPGLPRLPPILFTQCARGSSSRLTRITNGSWNDIAGVAAGDRGTVGPGLHLSVWTGASWNSAPDWFVAGADRTRRSHSVALHTGAVVFRGSESDCAGYAWNLFADSQSDLYMRGDFSGWAGSDCLAARASDDSAFAYSGAGDAGAARGRSAGGNVWRGIPRVPGADVVLMPSPHALLFSSSMQTLLGSFA